MRDLANLILILIIILLLTVAKFSHADVSDPIAECRHTLSLCDKTVDALQEHVKLLEESSKQKDEHIEALNKAVQDNSSALPSWAWALIGASAGLITVEVIK